MMRYAVPARLAHVITEEAVEGSAVTLRVALLAAPDGVPVVMTDSAALIWMVAAEGSRDVVEDVATSVEQPVEAIRPDVEAFLDDLVRRGLIAQQWAGEH